MNNVGKKCGKCDNNDDDEPEAADAEYGVTQPCLLAYPIAFFNNNGQQCMPK